MAIPLAEVTIPSVGEAFEADGITYRAPFVHDVVEHSVVVFEGLPLPTATRYEDVQRLQRDRRLASAAIRFVEFQGVTAGPVYERIVRSLFALDGQELMRLRRLVTAVFTPKTSEQFRKAVEAHVGRLIDEALEEGPSFDAVSQLAQRFPGQVICELLGVPVDARARFEDNVAAISRLTRLEPDLAAALPDIEAAMSQNDSLMTELIGDRRSAPQEDLLTKLAHADDGGDNLSEVEISQFASDLMMAGIETTRNQLAMTLRLFCGYPGQWEYLRDDAGLLANAVEESLRRLPTISGTPRLVSEDLEVGDIAFPPGAFIALASVTANIDPDVFDDPLVFDIRRVRAPHLTFGGGAHHCLGSHLARVELQAALAVLSRRLKHIELDGEPTWRPGDAARGLERLQLAVSPA